MTKKKLELKGNFSKKLKLEQRKKMEKTLDTMQKNREKDSINLRDLAESKLKWAKEAKEKRIKKIEELQENLKQLQLQIVKLDGVILAYNELLEKNKKEEDK